MAAVEEQRPRPSASASPTPVQEPTPTDEPTYEPTEGGEAGGAPSAGVYYVDCAAAREAGAGPLAQGATGYSRSLDRAGDGLACQYVFDFSFLQHTPPHRGRGVL